MEMLTDTLKNCIKSWGKTMRIKCIPCSDKLITPSWNQTWVGQKNKTKDTCTHTWLRKKKNEILINGCNWRTFRCKNVISREQPLKVCDTLLKIYRTESVLRIQCVVKLCRVYCILQCFATSGMAETSLLVDGIPAKNDGPSASRNGFTKEIW